MNAQLTAITVEPSADYDTARQMVIDQWAMTPW